jgi:hypothetical protein
MRHTVCVRSIMVAAGLILALTATAQTQGTYPTGPGDPFVAVPADLDLELRMKAAFDGEDIVWLFEWEAAGNWYHDMVVYRDGAWARQGGSTVGEAPYGIYEDRITFLVDPGTVRGFANQGCYVSCHSGSRFLSDQIPPATIQAVPELANRTDLRKYIAESRVGDAWWDTPWDTLQSPEVLQQLRDVGVFLDFWHWRAHRGNPVGYSDDQYVLEYRLNDGSRGAYATNWDSEKGQPAFMFDESKVGFVALDWERMVANGYDQQNDIYYLTEETAVPFDPDRAWRAGDVIPRIILREPQGSQAAITADGTWANGTWRVELRRAMDTGYATTDHALLEGRTYNVGFAVHANATGSRWHYISHPVQVGIGVPADFTVVRFEGDAPDWSAIPWTTLPLFYPAQVTWEWLVSDAHAGAPDVRADTRSCIDCHGETQQSVLKLAQASTSRELRGPAAQTNRWMTLATVMVLLGAGSVVALTLTPRRED